MGRGRGEGRGRTAPGDTTQGGDTLMKVKNFLRLNFRKKGTGETITWKVERGGSGDDDVKRSSRFEDNY